MLRGLLVPATLALVLAGCVQAPPLETASIADLADPAQRIVTFDAGGILGLDPDFADLSIRISPIGYWAGEPTLGVTSDGTIFMTAADQQLVRSMDHGETWELIETGDLLQRPKTNLDPWMWVDPWTDRVFNAPLYVACTWLTWSDDLGDSWDFNPVAGCVQGIPAHDHQKLTSGPAPEGVTIDGYDGLVYYSYNSFRREGTWIQVSRDGGQTFDLGQVVHPASCHSGIAGPVAVGNDGVAYSPKPTCDGIEMAVTKDGGRTWDLASVEDVGSADALAHMTDAAVDIGLNAYGTWTGEDGLPYITRTTDQGATWSKPIRVSPPDITSSVHNTIIAGEAGHVAVAYIGTRADTSKWESKDAQAADDTAVWHMFLSMTENALDETPVWTTVQVTPDDDPVQIGAIWLSGGSGEDGNRNLLDFFEMVQRDGRIYIGYADGCDKCTSVDDSKAADGVVALLEAGPSLLGGLLPPLPEVEMDHAHEAAPALGIPSLR